MTREMTCYVMNMMMLGAFQYTGCSDNREGKRALIEERHDVVEAKTVEPESTLPLPTAQNSVTEKLSENQVEANVEAGALIGHAEQVSPSSPATQTRVDTLSASETDVVKRVEAVALQLGTKTRLERLPTVMRFVEDEPEGLQMFPHNAALRYGESINARRDAALRFAVYREAYRFLHFDEEGARVSDRIACRDFSMLISNHAMPGDALVAFERGVQFVLKDESGPRVEEFRKDDRFFESLMKQESPRKAIALIKDEFQRAHSEGLDNINAFARAKQRVFAQAASE